MKNEKFNKENEKKWKNLNDSAPNGETKLFIIENI